jgi:hypothetical protein
MNDIAKAVMEIDVELAQALRFSVSDTRDDIEPIARFWKDLIADIKNGEQTLVLAGDIRPVLVEGPVKIGSQEKTLNSPLVAVIEDITTSGDEAGLYRCALVYQGGGRVIAGPGDIIANSGDSQVMIEAWNMFTLQEKDLGPATFFQLSQKTVEAVKIYAAFDSQLGHEEYPELDISENCWKFPAMTSDDPRLRFRETEVKVGYILGVRIFALLDEIETRPVKRPLYLRLASSQKWVPALSNQPRPKLRLVV